MPVCLQPFHALGARLCRRFAREDGSVTVEAVIMLPALIWCYLGTYVFFDAYRAQTVNIKAAYTLADTLSREENYVTPNFIESLHNLQEFLVSTDLPVSLRATVIGYDADADSYMVRWSQGRGGPAAMTTAQLNGRRDEIPAMSPVDRAVLIETWVDYSPAFDVGLGTFTFEDFVVMRPRSGGPVCWNPVENGTFATAVC